MNGSVKAVLLASVCALSVVVPSAVRAVWVTDGVALCAATGDQIGPQVASDGAGGAIVAWSDWRGMNRVVYAQRVNPLGEVEWAANGVRLCTAPGEQIVSSIISDGEGGAIVAWYDWRSASRDIYAQKVNSSGEVAWDTMGVALCTATGDQYSTMIVSDGAGGAIVTWYDYRSGNNDIYARRVNASGIVQWTTNGVALCTATGDQNYPQIVSDGAGGAIVTWYDYRGGNFDIYAQRVNASGVVQWTANGIALCTATGNQMGPQVSSDSAGGAIVAWYDYRSGNYDIYAQRVNAAGIVQWTANGLALCTATGNQMGPQLASDGAGGAIITWPDYRGGNYDMYAQRVNPSGTVQWTTNGVALCTATGDQNYPQIVSDGAGGAIVTWYDYRNGNCDLYAHRVNAAGAVQWTTNGVALCTAAGDQSRPTIISTGAGGAIVTWDDGRSIWELDIYAQAVNSQGEIVAIAPEILSVQDVPNDQGGWARLTVARSELDDSRQSTYPIYLYNVWQRIDNPALLAFIDQGSGDAVADAQTSEASLKDPTDPSTISGWPIREWNGRFFLQSEELAGTAALPPGTWELIGSFAACQQEQYIYRASTLADSTTSGIPYSAYMVSAHTTTPSVWFVSEPDSGYSVDNLPPGAPVGLVVEQSFVPVGLELSWEINPENDLSCYAVYRGLSEDFVPGSENRVATPTAPEWFDSSWRWDSGYYYKVTAIDVHDNQSRFALVRPDDVTGHETPKAPDASYLTQNYPNPFNPTTRISFGLSAPEHVSLRIYDAAGRLVRVLINEERLAGRYEVAWDGRDSNGRTVSSGIYFYRLTAGSFEETRKMVLTR
jgi:hypothetical protein